MSASPPFALEGGRVVFGHRAALDGVDFRLEAGEFLALLGDNGAGKTTLVKALLGLLPLDAGRLEVFGAPASRFRQRHRIGYVPQRFGAATGVPASVFEVVISGRVSKAGLVARYGAADREAARRALETVRLAPLARRPVATLSGGQQQRTLIARALAADPDALVLDEPASGVDVESQEALAETLGKLNSQGRSVLLVAHGLGAMASLVDRVVVIDAGRTVYEGPPLFEGVTVPHIHVHTHAYLEHQHHHPPPEEP